MGCNLDNHRGYQPGGMPSFRVDLGHFRVSGSEFGEVAGHFGDLGKGVCEVFRIWCGIDQKTASSHNHPKLQARDVFFNPPLGPTGLRDVGPGRETWQSPLHQAPAQWSKTDLQLAEMGLRRVQVPGFRASFLFRSKVHNGGRVAARTVVCVVFLKVFLSETSGHVLVDFGGCRRERLGARHV